MLKMRKAQDNVTSTEPTIKAALFWMPESRKPNSSSTQPHRVKNRFSSSAP